MSEKERVKEYTNLYSMGLLPKIEGRYLTGPKPKSKLRLNVRRHDFSMENARVRLQMELKRIQLSQRINGRSQRNRNRSLCRTEPVQSSSRSNLNTIHVKSIDICLPERTTHLKKAISLTRPHPLTTNHSSPPKQGKSMQTSAVLPGSSSPSQLKVKFGKKALEEEAGGVSPEGMTIGQWVHSSLADKTHNHFHLYSQEVQHEDRGIDNDAEAEMSGQMLKFIKFEKPKRQFLFKAPPFPQTNQ